MALVIKHSLTMTSDLHPHCSTCVNFHCPEPARLGASCDVTSCPLECGAAFHSCKASEHRFLCPLEIVACPSSAYGCPLTMPRARVAQHLSVCPASVVRCRHTHFPSMHTNPTDSYSYAFEHSTDTHNGSIQSNDAHVDFTQVSSIQTQNVKMWNVKSGLNGSDIRQDALHKRSKSIHDGEDMSLCNVVTNGICKDQSVTDSHLDQSDRAETNEDGTEGCCGGMSGDITPDFHHSAGESSASWEEERIMSQPLSDLDAFPPCYDRETRLHLLQRFLPPDLSARLADTPASQGGKPIQDQTMEESSTAAAADHVECVELETGTTATQNMETLPEEASLVWAPLATTAAMPSQTVPTAGTLTGTSVHLSPCQGHGEPHDMCGQLFRRDEFLWHSRNVHADLDLLERTCPLSTYGCPVTQRQLCASLGTNTRSNSCAHTRAHLVYDAHLGAFGLRPFTHTPLPATPTVTSDPQGLDRLSALPMELLHHLLGYLDGFSLNQLALVSARMREVCASLLRVRGMVLLRWTTSPTHSTGTRRWTVQDKVWRFSTAFSHVESWDLVEAPSLSNHLQCCRWNQVERHLEARALPCMSGTPELERRKPIRAHHRPATRNTPSLSHSLAAMESPDKGCR